MTRPAAPRAQPGQAPLPARRAEVLDAVRRRRADSQQCRQRSSTSWPRCARTARPSPTRRSPGGPTSTLSTFNDTDLKAEAEAVRAHLAQDRPRAAAAATARKEAALEAENRMLLEHNAALQRALQEVQNELRTLRAHDLSARLRDGLNARSMRDTEMEELRRQKDAALAAGRQAETAMQALRNVNQRLMIENSRLVAAVTPEIARTTAATPEPSGP